MKQIYSFLTLLTFVAVTPKIAVAGNSCENICTKMRADAQAMLSNPACKNDPTCVQCVNSATLQSQSGTQCTSAEISKGSKTMEVSFATINTAATLVCGTACTLSLIPGVGNATERAWGQACGWAGWGVTAAEVAETIVQITQKKKVDYLGLATKAYGAKSLLATTAKAAEQAVIDTVKSKTTMVGKMIANPACMNAVLFGVAAQAKIKSISRDQKNADQSCSNVNLYAGSAGGSVVQSCLGVTTLSGNSTKSSAAEGQFAVTAQTYPAPTIDDVDRLSATANLNSGLKSLKADLSMAVVDGKLDYGDIAKKLDSGADLPSILAGSQMNADLVDAIKEAGSQINAEGTSKIAALMGQGSTTAIAGSQGQAPKQSSDFGDLNFGNSGATPGEGATSLDIDRKPAQSATAPGLDDSDVFHGAYLGTIFDIVTNRLKAQKGNYAELDPEGRMNRLFNGYGEPGSKPVRKPASDRSAK